MKLITKRVQKMYKPSFFAAGTRSSRKSKKIHLPAQRVGAFSLLYFNFWACTFFYIRQMDCFDI